MRLKRGLPAYFASACLARSADSGATVGIVLLAGEVAPGTAVGGLLAACLTAPHLAGPFAARLLDRTRRKKGLLAGAFLLYGGSLALAGVLLSHQLIPLAAIAAVLGGACGPLLTGGLSSLLASLVHERESAQHRAEGMDAFTYGVASTCGPALVAAVAAIAGPPVAVMTATVLALAAAAALLLLPTLVNARAGITTPVLTVHEALAVLVRTDPLRRVAVGTALSAMPVGALALLALAFALDHHGTGVQGALLVTVNGVGAITGSTMAIVRPLRGDPDRLVRWRTLAIAVGFALCAVSPNIVVAGIAFFVTGAATSLQLAASLAARSDYSPKAARAQIFVTMGGLKVACSSLGVALVGLANGIGSLWLLLSGFAVALIGVVYMSVDRARTNEFSPSQNR